MIWEKNFTTDLAQAHKIENKLADLFRNNINCTVTTSQDLGSFSDYDLKVDFTDEKFSKTIEVKEDKWVRTTGNIAVEFQRTFSDGTVRPTCISISKSDLYAYYLVNEFFIIDTDELRRLIADKKYFFIANNSGDGGRASCYLFKKEVFCKSAVPLKTFLNK